MRKRILTVISIIAMVVAAAGPGQAASEAEEEAIEAAGEWLALVDAGKMDLP